MVNIFTAQGKVSKIQQEVLLPLYTMHETQETATHDWLLVETGRIISKHRHFIEELCDSWTVAAVFRIVKLLGGADRLTVEDFERFTSYVKDGGIKAMVEMLLAAEKERAFVNELRRLPRHVQENAPDMLRKSKDLHSDFIHGFFKEHFGDPSRAPDKLQENFAKSSAFISRLASLAADNLKSMV